MQQAAKVLSRSNSFVKEDRPQNPLRIATNAVGSVMSVAMTPVNLLNEGFAQATNFVAQALPSFPAATLGSLAIGAPHAHIAHPPSGPAPIPPTPLPPVGSVLLGNCVQVLIGGMPAARCGDLGLSPTCCGLTSFFEIFTGSSKVFIGGARAARMLDLTWHCRSSSDQAKRAAAMGLKAAAKAAAMAALKSAAVSSALPAMSAAADGLEAMETDDSALSATMAMSAGLQAAQMANDIAAAVAGALMGKDQPAVPPTGTMGALMMGVPNVLIGGFPMPSWMEIAKGLLKLAKGLKGKGKKNPCGQGKPKFG